jgi:hypothetical protein
MIIVPPLAIGKLRIRNGGVLRHCAMANAGKTFFAQFTNVRSIYKCAEHSSRVLQVKNDGRKSKKVYSAIGN